ncbi:G5P family DNA-binding protein [Xanthomonas sp. CFBP 8445]|uniref:G5P family DNA-binding protein n=1 Tax=Xanthomonas sp. CFBP 8445 TaxID=2971236 RepID=UPI0021E094FF|nr:G5P family DNA-binding protein [Xanthomonas sp. CFBP 8445]UYC14013.1 G5P family DNA-binding protein [Xanthomonas sp. CFBP 8445]
MKITITSIHVNEKHWEKGGRSGIIRTQEASAETPKFRQTVRLDLGKEPPYEPGIYDLNLEDNVTVNQYGDLGLPRKPTLVRVDKPAQQPAPVKAA